MFGWLFGKSEPLPTPIPQVPVQHDIVLPPEFTGTSSPSANCIALIERQEGCALKAYQDVDGSWVIGYGCKVFDGKAVVEGQTTDADGAHRNCVSHAKLCASAILTLTKSMPLRQGQLDAFTDFVYNIGLAALQQSTLLRTFLAKQPVSEDLFTMWNKIHKDGQLVVLPALTLRRQAEYQLFIGS